MKAPTVWQISSQTVLVHASFAFCVVDVSSVLVVSSFELVSVTAEPSLVLVSSIWVLADAANSVTAESSLLLVSSTLLLTIFVCRVDTTTKAAWKMGGTS